MLSALLQQISEPGGTISAIKLGETLHLPIADIARLAHVHRNTISQTPRSPAVQSGLGEVASILTAASDLVGGDIGRAVVWFRHQPLAGFSGRTAAELVTDGHAEAVRRHLEMLRDGGYA
jgi:uncharacterized protein (DUF2384 family)